MPRSGRDLTALVNGGAANREAACELWVSCYPVLRRLAARAMSAGDREHTLQPTALVNEAWLRMIDRERVTEEGTSFFRSCFATECRRILVEAARRRRAGKRGGHLVRHTLSDVDSRLGRDDVDLLDLHEAIEALGRLRPRLAQVVDLRIFGGLTVPEVARELAVAPSTVDKDWAFARSWLRRKVRELEAP